MGQRAFMSPYSCVRCRDTLIFYAALAQSDIQVPDAQPHFLHITRGMLSNSDLAVSGPNNRHHGKQQRQQQ